MSSRLREFIELSKLIYKKKTDKGSVTLNKHNVLFNDNNIEVNLYMGSNLSAWSFIVTINSISMEYINYKDSLEIHESIIEFDHPSKIDKYIEIAKLVLKGETKMKYKRRILT